MDDRRSSLRVNVTGIAPSLSRSADRSEEAQSLSREQARATWNGQAMADFPWLNDPNSEQFKLASRIVAQRPWLKKEASFLGLLGATTEYIYRKFNPPAGGNGAPAPAKPMPRTGTMRPPATGSGSPTPPAGREARIAAASKRVDDNPSEESLIEYIEAAVLRE